MCNTSTTNIDVNGLRILFRSDVAAFHILGSFAERQNNWKITTVSSLFTYFRFTGKYVSRKEIVRVFKELEKLNCGALVVGKISGNRNLQTRIIWKVPIGTVGKLAAGKMLRN